MYKDDPLSYLLDLDGEILIQECGYWVKVEARICAASPQVPHGISYSLTLHAGKLLEDFFAAVDRVLKERGVA